MALPKRRTGPAKQGLRRSHHRVTSPQMARCPQCRSLRVNHRVCGVCGSYNGKQILGPSDSNR